MEHKLLVRNFVYSANIKFSLQIDALPTLVFSIV